MITTGSGIERFMSCRASNVLHRAYNEGGQYATDGIEAHAFLQRVIGGMSRESSLEEVDERFRDSISEIDLEDLDDVLGLTPEMALAYHPEADTARVLGVGIERAYEAAGVTEDEIPLTVDVAGLDNKDPFPEVGLVIDWKRGWSRLTPAAQNWQMRGGALALARAFNLDRVRVQLIHLREDRPAYRDRATFGAADLAAFAAEARVRYALARADRTAYKATREEPDATMGSWCRFCPSFHACSAQTALIKRIADVDEIEQLDNDAVATAYRRVRAARAALAKLDTQIHAAAARMPVLIETLPDGAELWLGTTTVTGNRKLDPHIARAVVREMLDEAAVEEVSKHEVAVGRIEAAAKARAPRGQGAAKARAILEEINRRDGVHRPTRHDVDLYKLSRSLPPAKSG